MSMPFNNQVGPPTKRKRLATSCSDCRRRKIKCDKNRPVCSMCSKNNITCVYQDPSWNENINLSNNYINAASIPMAHIKVSDVRKSNTFNDRIMSFYDYEEPVHFRGGRLATSGPLSLSSVIKKDSFLKFNIASLRKQKLPVRTQMITNKYKKSKDLVKEIIIDDKFQSPIDENFKKTLIENEGIDDISSNRNQIDIPSQKSHIFNLNQENYETETILKIEQVLPYEKLIWILFDRYFNSILCAFMPVITELKLKEKIIDIIGQKKPNIEDNSRLKSIRIIKRFDFAYMGILLIILRITSLSVTKHPNNTIEEKYILANPIGLNVVNVAQMCLNQFKLLRRGAIPTLECCLFMRYYHKFAPEDGDGNDGGDGQVFLGMLLQMANSVGLNRDPNHSFSLKDIDKLSNVWRSIWHEIVDLDIRQSLNLGDPILIDENYYDTLLPMFNENETLVQNFNIYESFIKNFRKTDEVNKIIKTILKLILNIKDKIKITELMAKLNDLEIYMKSNFTDLNSILNLEIFNVEDSINKIFKFLNYIEIKTSLYIIYYHMFLELNDFNIFLKALEIMMELNPLNHLLIYKNNPEINYFNLIFGNDSQIIIIPYLISSLQKINLLQTGIISRCLDIKFNVKNFKNNKLIEEIFTEAMNQVKILRKGFNNLSSEYFQSWKSSKFINLLYNIFNNLDNNIWDKKVSDLEKFPNNNEFVFMGEMELNKILSRIRNPEYEENLNRLLNKDKVYKYEDNNLLNKDNLEIDRLWLQMIANNNNLNKQEVEGNTDNVINNNLVLNQFDSNLFDPMAFGVEEFDFDKLMGGASLYDVFGE